MEDHPLHEMLLNPGVGQDWWWHRRIAEEHSEMIVGHPPDVSEDDHEGRQPNLWLVLELTFIKNGSPLIQAIKDVCFVGQHGWC
jgi:hypothetical protein